VQGNLISGSIYNIECTNSNAIIENNTVYNGVNGIRIVSSNDAYIAYNEIFGCSGAGLKTEWSSSRISNNLIHENQDSGIWIYKSNNVKIWDNFLKGNKIGLDVQYSDYLNIYGNLIKDNTNDGIITKDSYNLTIRYNSIEGNENGIYLKDSLYITILNDNITNNQEKAVLIYNCSDIHIEAAKVTLNKIGISLQSSSSTLSNITFSENSEKDLYLIFSSDLVSINSSIDFDNILVSNDCQLTVKNYLHIYVKNQTYKPIENAEVEVKDDGKPIYLLHSDNEGYVGFILITDRVYEGSNTPNENDTLVNISFDSLNFLDNPREVEMSASHLELFAPENPLSITIDTPSNKTLIFDTFNITGSADTPDSEDITVEIRVDDGEWISVNYTGDDWSLWWLEFDTTKLPDGEHVISARISSPYFEREESIIILVDNFGNKPPVLSISSHESKDIVSDTVMIKGNAIDYDGHIESVDVSIDDGEWIIANNLGGDWANWSFEFDSTEYSNGTHEIAIMAVDNSSESTSIYLELEFKNAKSDLENEDPIDKEWSPLPLLMVIIPLILCIVMFLIIKRIKDKELAERYSSENNEEEEFSTDDNKEVEDDKNSAEDIEEDH
jgi:parallel beta-helix repeat protein